MGATDLFVVARRRPGLVLAVGALLIRLAWVAWVSRDVPAVLGDQYSYWYYARSIAEGGGYISYATGEATAYYPIGWPALLGAVYFVADHSMISLSDAVVTGVLQSVLGALSVWLLFVIARKVFDTPTAIVGAALLAVFPSAVYSAATYSIETPFIASALAVLAIIVTTDWNAGPSTRRTVALAVLLAVSVTIRPFSVPFLVVIGLAAWRGAGWRAAVRTTAIVLGAVVVSAVPWTIRNAVALDAFVPSSTNLGDTMCMSRFPGSDGGFRWADHEWCADAMLPEAERSTANVEAALRFIVEHPGEEARQIVRRFAKMMAHDHESLGEVTSVHLGQVSAGAEHALAGIADWTFRLTSLAALVGVGLTVAQRWRDSDVQSIVLTAAFLLVIPLGLWGGIRFHAPLVPLITLFAAVAVVAAARLRAPSTDVVPATGAGNYR